MRNRRPADQRAQAYYGRTGEPLARSPAERLEPTRPGSRRRRGFDDEPARLSPLLRVISGLFTFLLLLLLLTGGLALLFNSSVEAPGPLVRPKVVVIPKGEGAHEIGARLEREGAVSDRRLFVAEYLWAKFATWRDGTRPLQLRAGDYAIPEAASVRQIVALLSEGKTHYYKAMIPEGLTSQQIIERLKADANLTGDIAELPAEGTLLPDTIVVERGASRQSVVDGMVAEQRRLMERTWAHRKQELPLKSWEEAVILASIVEKETGRGDERERVAAVFVNRLKRNMRLQSDPTILYGLSPSKVIWSRAIQKSEIAQKTSHNTYQIDGLPPTPICNPGRAAIAAVLNFADTKDLYFVADGAGGHLFAETLKDHNANVVKWRAHEKEAHKPPASQLLNPAAQAATGDKKVRVPARSPQPHPAAPALKAQEKPQ
jgi:UPF0755 protein